MDIESPTRESSRDNGARQNLEAALFRIGKLGRNSESTLGI
jgi:hypothetical protein